MGRQRLLGKQSNVPETRRSDPTARHLTVAAGGTRPIADTRIAG